MKKRLLVMLGVLVLAIGMTACTSSNEGGSTVVEDTNDGNNDANTGSDDNTTGGSVEEASIDSALAAYETIWGSFADSEKFAAIGGDMANAVSDAPGSFNLDDKDSLTGLFYVPADYVDKIDDAATLMHMMNANTYTGIIAHVDDAQGYADAVKASIDSVQWVCGCPDRLIITDLGGGYVAYAFGEATIIDDYNSKIQQNFPSAKNLYDVNLVQ